MSQDWADKGGEDIPPFDSQNLRNANVPHVKYEDGSRPSGATGH